MKITEKLKFKGNGIFWCLAGIFLTGALPLIYKLLSEFLGGSLPAGSY